VDAVTDSFIAFISNENNFVGLLALALAAMIEYVVPPVPGDTVTLFGAILITAYDWSFWGVFGAVMAGSVLGSMMAFYIGGWWRKRRERSGHRHESIDRLVEKFHRHGAAYLVINRFLPGIRSVFFVAAGLAEMRPLAVLAYSAVSAALWNLGLIAAGSALGANFETLRDWVQRYTMATWMIIGGVALVWLARTIIKRRLRRRGAPGGASGKSLGGSPGASDKSPGGSPGSPDKSPGA
jgi:membrane protein DedA with SNARE-associated domain